MCITFFSNSTKSNMHHIFLGETIWLSLSTPSLLRITCFYALWIYKRLLVPTGNLLLPSIGDNGLPWSSIGSVILPPYDNGVCCIVLWGSVMDIFLENTGDTSHINWWEQPQLEYGAKPISPWPPLPKVRVSTRAPLQRWLFLVVTSSKNWCLHFNSFKNILI